VPELRGLVIEADPLLDRLKPVAKRLPAVFKQTRPILHSASRLVRRGRTNIAKLRPLLIDTGPLLDEFGPLVDQMNPAFDWLRAYSPELVGFFQLTADVLSNYDVNGHMTRFSTLLIQVAKHANELPIDSNAAGSLERPFNRLPGVAEGEPWEDFSDSFIGGAKGFDP
jgi:hypothetical protein